MRAACVLSLGLALLGLACTRQDDASVAIAREPPIVPAGPLPEEVALLGKPCPPDGTHDPSTSNGVCNKEGRIGLVVLNRRTGVPEGARLFEGSFGRVVVAVEASRVWVQSTCVMCRVLSESTSIADLSLATDDQLVSLQTEAEMPPSPLLRTPAAWREAVAAWHPRR